MSTTAHHFPSLFGKTGPIKGAKPSVQTAQLLTSSGCQSFDQIIGGGIPVGSLVLIEEDRYVTFSKLLLKYYLAEGIASQHSVLVGSKDVNTQQLIIELPKVIETEQTVTEPENEDMVIAWRYKNMQTVQSSPQSSQFGHFYDLSGKIDPKLIASTEIHHWNDGSYNDLLHNISEQLLSGSFTKEQNPHVRNILRIGLCNLGSPLWDHCDKQNLATFFYKLKALLRSSFACCMITVPVHLVETTTRLQIEHLSDICIRLESFTGTSLEKNQTLKDYHGFFKIVKLAACNTLVAPSPESADLAFKLRRKKLVIEKLHLPPELDNQELTCSFSGRDATLMDF